MKKFKSKWSFGEIFLTGLITAISINYLVGGFVDIVLNINSLINWLQQSNLADITTQLIQKIIHP